MCFPFYLTEKYSQRTRAESVFHAALVVFSAIQIHETRSALVRTPDCDGSVDFVVCSTLCCSYSLTNSHVPLPRLVVARALCSEKWSIYSLQSRPLSRPRGLSCFSSCEHSTSNSGKQLASKLGGLRLTGPSWAVFRIVGANPAMKSQCFRYCCGLLS